MAIRQISWLIALCFAAAALPAYGIVLYETGDPTRNTSTPGDNSGWQYEGQFDGVCATPIAPLYFIAAQHIGGTVGDALLYHGESYTTVGYTNDPATDLRIWQVQASHPFTVYAPLYATGAETGQPIRVFGHGAERGAPMSLDGVLKGWAPGTDPASYIQRWGANIVEDLPYSGQYLRAAFDRNGVPNEAQLTAEDSSGGVFIQEDGLWKLAAINYGVTTVLDQNGNAVTAPLFDLSGYYYRDGNGVLTQIPEDQGDVPTSFYSTRIAPRLSWISTVINGIPALPTESYADWLHGYYSPDEIANAAISDPGADPDEDGVSNLLEFAFNLDPTFAEPAILTPMTGVRGLPSIRAQGGQLTVEYLRRTAASGPGVTYAAQFASDLAAGDWTTNSNETVTPINARWERVTVVDSAPASGGSRFARMQVTVDAP